MGWVGYVAGWGEGKETQACFWWGSLKERGHLEGLGVDVMIKRQNFKLI